MATKDHCRGHFTEVATKDRYRVYFTEVAAKDHPCVHFAEVATKDHLRVLFTKMATKTTVVWLFCRGGHRMMTANSYYNHLNLLFQHVIICHEWRHWMKTQQILVLII